MNAGLPALRDFVQDDTDAVIALWQACGLTRSWNDPRKDIERKLTDGNGAFWVNPERAVSVSQFAFNILTGIIPGSGQATGLPQRNNGIRIILYKIPQGGQTGIHETALPVVTSVIS